jgi:hypothetical protein
MVVNANSILRTQTSPAPQLLQSVTSRHSVGGRQGPQHESSALWTVPEGHAAGSARQVTRAMLQLRLITQRPNTQVTSFGWIWLAVQESWVQIAGQFGSTAPFGSARHVQQSLNRAQSSAFVHSAPEAVPAAPDMPEEPAVPVVPAAPAIPATPVAPAAPAVPGPPVAPAPPTASAPAAPIVPALPPPLAPPPPPLPAAPALAPPVPNGGACFDPVHALNTSRVKRKQALAIGRAGPSTNRKCPRGAKGIQTGSTDKSARRRRGDSGWQLY